MRAIVSRNFLRLHVSFGLGLLALALCGACGQAPAPSRDPIRLVDGFSDAIVEGTPPSVAPVYGPTSWRFDQNDAGFRAEGGVEALRVEEGRLKGTTTTDQPVLVVARPTDIPDDERVFAIEIRASVSAGTDLTVRLGSDPLMLPRVLGNPFGEFKTPLRAGDGMQTYRIRPGRTVRADDAAHVVILPSNESGADFEIETVDLIFEREHLASIPSGVRWHGLSEIYRESIVSRAPETIRFSADLPAAPAIEVAVGITETTQVTFRVEVASEDGVLRTLEHRVETAGSWEELWLDLEGLEGESVDVSLSLDSEDPGAIGVWGHPAIRSNSPESDLAGVILIIADTLRSDHLAAYGYERETAPTVTRLAAEGVRFEHAITQGTWTKVSVPAIQTSLYPTTHTVEDVPDRLPATAETIAEVYRDAGYSTLALTTIPFVGQLTALHQGYEVLHEGSSVADGLGPKSARYHVSRLLPWIEKHRDTPFFALLHIADPHSPYRPLPEDEELFSAPGAMDQLDELLEKVRPHITHSDLMRRFGMPLRKELVAASIDPEEFVRHELDGYDGSIRGMDIALTELFAKVDELGLTERILVAIVSDHGTEFLEHDAHFHGHTVYGELNRVPLILWGPGHVPGGVVVEPTVQTIDLMPTLLDLSGLSIPERAQGASLRPLFESPEEARWNRPAITEMPAEDAHSERAVKMTAIQIDEWKLIRVSEAGGEPRYELYQHLEDPLNQSDLAAAHPEVVTRLARQLDQWQVYAESVRLDETDPTAGMDAEELERLRSLGYI